MAWLAAKDGLSYAMIKMMEIYMAYLRPLLISVALLLLPCACTAQSSEQGSSASSLRDTAVFYANVAKIVSEHYVEPTDPDKLLEGALNGMLTSLDPHSAYLTPAKYEELKNQTQGKFGGLGMEVTMDDGLIKVIAPLEGTPADAAGIKPGDLIIRINDTPVFGLSLIKAVEMLKGEPGTGVELVVRRGDEPDMHLKLKRAIINVKPVRYRREGNVGYIRISTFFNDLTDKMVQDAVYNLQKEIGPKLEGFLIDLRNNAGGLLDQAVAVSDLFLPKGVEIVSIQSRNAKKVDRIVASNSDITNGAPIAILINGGSASASEILAGALQDHRRAIIVGTPSFGKGSVQSVLPLKNGGALRMTTALYITPSGRIIQKRCITPDIVIEQAYDLKVIDESKRIRESNFESAVDPVRRRQQKTTPQRATKPQSNTKGQTSDQANQIKDYQMLEAIDVLRGISLYHRTDIKKQR